MVEWRIISGVLILILLAGCTGTPNDPPEIGRSNSPSVQGQAAYTGTEKFGSPIDFSSGIQILDTAPEKLIFDSAEYKELLVVKAGKEEQNTKDPLIVIWNKYYIYEHDEWQEYTFPQKTYSDSNWIVQYAEGIVPVHIDDVDEGENTIIAFVCVENGKKFDCGCASKDDCGYWTAVSFTVVKNAACFSDSDCGSGSICINELCSELPPPIVEEPMTCYPKSLNSLYNIVAPFGQDISGTIIDKTTLPDLLGNPPGVFVTGAALSAPGEWNLPIQYSQKIKLGPEKISVRHTENDDDLFSHFMVIDTDEPFIEFQIEYFNLAANVQIADDPQVKQYKQIPGFSGKNIGILDMEYTITSAITLLNTYDVLALNLMSFNGKPAISGGSLEGETRTYTFNKQNVEVTPVYISIPPSGLTLEVKFSINGELTQALTVGDTDTLSNGVQIHVSDIKNIDGNKHVKYFLGTDSIQLRDTTINGQSFNGVIEINNENINDMAVSIEARTEPIPGTPNVGMSIDRITMQLTMDPDRSSEAYVPINNGIRNHMRRPESLISPNFNLLYKGINQNTAMFISYDKVDYVIEFLISGDRTITPIPIAPDNTGTLVVQGFSYPIEVNDRTLSDPKISVDVDNDGKIDFTTDFENNGAFVLLQGGAEVIIQAAFETCTEVCGDNVCAVTETCSSCSQDCGTCQRVCIDYDGGVEPYIGSYIEFSLDNGLIETYHESCTLFHMKNGVPIKEDIVTLCSPSTANTDCAVYEGSCNREIPYIERYTCEYGCTNGACNQEPVVCTGLEMVWSTGGRRDPYIWTGDLCDGYRCLEGNEVSPSCYNELECPGACNGACIKIDWAEEQCPTIPPPESQCGNNKCETNIGESCFSCSADCGQCPTNKCAEPFLFDQKLGVDIGGSYVTKNELTSLVGNPWGVYKAGGAMYIPGFFEGKQSASYSQRIMLGPEEVSVLEAENDDNVFATYLVIDTDEPFFQWETEISDLGGVVHPDYAQVFDIIGKNIGVLDREFTIVDAGSFMYPDNDLRLTLLSTKDASVKTGAVGDMIQEGETRTYTVDGKSLEVTLLSLSPYDGGDQFAVFSINGEVTQKLYERNGDTLSTGVYFFFTDVVKLSEYIEQLPAEDKVYYDSEEFVDQQTAVFYIGTEKIELYDPTTNTQSFDGDVEINNQNINDADLAIETSVSNGHMKINKISYKLEMDPDRASEAYIPLHGVVSQYMRRPESLLSPNFDLQYFNINQPSAEYIDYDNVDYVASFIIRYGNRMLDLEEQPADEAIPFMPERVIEVPIGTDNTGSFVYGGYTYPMKVSNRSNIDPSIYVDLNDDGTIGYDELRGGDIRESSFVLSQGVDVITDIYMTLSYCDAPPSYYTP